MCSIAMTTMAVSTPTTVEAAIATAFLCRLLLMSTVCLAPVTGFK